MNSIHNLQNTLTNSPSVALLCLKNKEWVIQFFVEVFPNQQANISSDKLHLALIGYIEKNIEVVDDIDEPDLIESINFYQELSAPPYEIKAKRYIQRWTNRGFLSNYQDEQGSIFFELSSHTHKTLDWLHSLKKEEYVGTESKFKNIFNQLKELVENTNGDVEKRIQFLEQKKLEIDQQIQLLQIGDNLAVYEEYQITPRFKELNQSAKELLSDFREVEDNFKVITKNIYQQHAEGIQDYIGKIGLELIIKKDEGFAFVKQLEDSEGNTLGLISRRQIGFEASIVLVVLRHSLEEFDSNPAQYQASEKFMTNLQIREELELFLQEGYNRLKFKKDLDNYIKTVEDLGYLKKVAEKDLEKTYQIQRIIKEKISLDILQEFKEKLSEYIKSI
ncbi:MAG: DUF3375 family protein [Gammaproteobacteria bacterium]|nr:DUF3375 family protein [Gammaproteobacteria bacterium]